MAKCAIDTLPRPLASCREGTIKLKKGADNMIPFQPPTDGEYTAVLTEGQILMTRRLQLGLTQAQVAKMAGLHLSQYQRLEGSAHYFSGCSVRIGMAVCSVLLLDPTEIVRPSALPADSTTLKPVPLFGEADAHRVGRKQIRRDIMSLTVTREQVIIPEDVLIALGRPPYVRYQHEKSKRRILLSAADEAGSGDIFAVSDEHTLIIPDKGIITEESQFTAKCRLVRDRKGALFVLCDLSTATPCKL